MSRKLIMILSALLTAVIAAYLGYNALDEMAVGVEYGSLENFFDEFLISPQKLIFNGMIYVLPVIYASSLSFAASEYLIRIKKELLFKLTYKSLLTSVVLTAYVIILETVAALVCGISGITASYLTGAYLKVVLFFLECHFMFYLFYTITLNAIAAIAAVFGVNMVILAIILNITFAGFLSGSGGMFAAFICICAIGCTAYVITAVLLKTKEIMLKNNEK